MVRQVEMEMGLRMEVEMGTMREMRMETQAEHPMVPAPIRKKEVLQAIQQTTAMQMFQLPRKQEMTVRFSYSVSWAD